VAQEPTSFTSAAAQVRAAACVRLFIVCAPEDVIGGLLGLHGGGHDHPLIAAAWFAQETGATPGRPAWRSSISSKAGTTLIAAIPPWTIVRQSTTRGAIQHRLIPAAPTPSTESG